MKILFISLGCDKNLVDSEVMLGLLTKHGYTLTDDETQADVIVINTCCFIHDAKEESINTILEMAQYKEQNLKALVVAGCLAERYKDEILKEIPEIDAVLGTTSYDSIVEAVNTALEENTGEHFEHYESIDYLPDNSEVERVVTTGNHMAYLKIAEGCDKRCSYCIIHAGRAKINPDKCVSCGMCMVNCPFGAIADKSQIYQLIKAMNEGAEVIAILAPAFVGQFGPKATPNKIKAALLDIGFADVWEVAVGADAGALEEAKHYVQSVATGKLPFLLTSCCPSWSMLGKKYFPEVIDEISNALTPMVATARAARIASPNAKIVFVGPCVAKKLEASRRTVRSEVDFVITFEELAGMFDAKEIDFNTYEKEEELNDAFGAGRGYAVASGVAGAIKACIDEYYPGTEVKIDHVEGLADCKKMLLQAKSGKKKGYLIEGMGCPGGCVAGAGTNIPVVKAQIQVKKFVKEAEDFVPPETAQY